MDATAFATGPARTGYLGSRGAAWFAFVLTCLLMVFDYIDRQIVVSMLPMIKVQWNLTDTELGGLVSIVSVTVGLFSIPVAVLADRWSRVKCIVAMAVIWSSATIACGFATSYWQLFMLRALIGVGEAGYGAAGAALLSSLFPSQMRAAILGAFTASAAFGAVLGVVLGGVVSSAWGWQAAFGVAGFPGLVLALLYLFVRDYKTVDVATPRDPSTPARLRLREGLRVLASSPSAFAIYAGSALQLFVVATVYSWLPSYLNRLYGLPVDQAAARAAIVLMVASAAAVLWGFVADRAGRSRPENKILVMVLTTASSGAVLAATFALVPPGPLQFACIILGAVLMTGTLGTVGAVTIDVVHPGLRATAIAIGSLISNLFGLAAGPFISGVLSDKFGLATALTVIPLFGLLAAIAFVLTIPLYRRDVAAHPLHGLT